MGNIIRLISNETQLATAQAEMGGLLEISNAGHERTAEQDRRLEELAMLIRSYEDVHWALALPHPILAIKSRMDDLGLKLADMTEEFGNKTTASLIMNRRRPLTLPVIRRLSVRLSLPIAVLAQDYPLVIEGDVASPKERISVTG